MLNCLANLFTRTCNTVISATELLFDPPISEAVRLCLWKILDKIYINQGVRQGCNLSPALFTIYTDDLLRNWKHKADVGIVLKRNLCINTLLFADDQVIIQDSEDKYSSEISPTRCNNCVFFRNGFTLHVSGDNLTHHQEYICCIWPQVSRLT